MKNTFRYFRLRSFLLNWRGNISASRFGCVAEGRRRDEGSRGLFFQALSLDLLAAPG